MSGISSGVIYALPSILATCIPYVTPFLGWQTSRKFEEDVTQEG